MKTNDGGPAFPHVPNSTYTGERGMSLRDWFAGQIATGFVIGTLGEAGPAAVAIKAYRFADALLAERDKANEKGGGE